MTGFGQQADKQRAKEASFDGHRLKLINYTTLGESVAKTIRAKQERSGD